MVTNLNSSFGSEDNNAPRARCEDAPCCGCCPSAAEMYEPFQQPPEADLLDEEEICRHDQDEDGDNMTDGEADADALASAGWGTDEDYGMEDRFLDSFWESQTECDFGGSDF
jgi:hypothetical protein